MESTKKNFVSVQAVIEIPVEKVWKCWTTPDDIIKWNNASEDWCTTKAENDLEIGGKFLFRMEAKDGSVGFDFWGIYEEVELHKKISYTLGDGRKVIIHFTSYGDSTGIIEQFETENTNTVEQQRFGWQAILNNFKKYAESIG